MTYCVYYRWVNSDSKYLATQNTNLSCPSGTEKEPGVIPRAVEEVFSYIEEVNNQQIYHMLTYAPLC